MIRRAGLASALLIAMLLLLPPLILETTGKTYWISVLTRATYFAIFVLSLDLFSGTTGYLNLGHALLIGLGAYTSGFISANYGLSPLVSALIGGATAAILGLILFLPSLRVKGIYFAVLTFLTPIVFLYLFASYPLSYYLGGEGGLFVRHHLRGVLAVLGVKKLAYRTLADYYFAAMLMLLFTTLSYKLTFKTSLGIKMRSIGQDEDLAKAAGIRTERVKALAFIIAAFMAGVAGAFYGHYVRVVTVDVFSPAVMLVPILTMWIIGGPGSILGPVAASYVVVVVEELVRPLLGDYRVMIYMALLLFLVVVRPSGLISWIILKMRRWLE